MNKEHVRFHFDLHDKSSMQCSGGPGWACLPLRAFVTRVWTLLTVRYVNCSKDFSAGGRKGKAFLCFFHLRERRAIRGDRKCFPSVCDLFYMWIILWGHHRVQYFKPYCFSLSACVFEWEVPGPWTRTLGSLLFGAHHSFCLWAAQWWVARGGLCHACTLPLGWHCGAVTSANKEFNALRRIAGHTLLSVCGWYGSNSHLSETCW